MNPTSLSCIRDCDDLRATNQQGASMTCSGGGVIRERLPLVRGLHREWSALRRTLATAARHGRRFL